MLLHGVDSKLEDLLMRNSFVCDNTEYVRGKTFLTGSLSLSLSNAHLFGSIDMKIVYICVYKSEGREKERVSFLF